ncbi:hypothetical protein [Streptomyces sp. NPDC091219]|uniref:hypothetical protein n=1 Tax=Streptomyces sp. NPDC091219 TaxID=3155193 RepID=UPI00344D4164
MTSAPWFVAFGDSRTGAVAASVPPTDPVRTTVSASAANEGRMSDDSWLLNEVTDYARFSAVSGLRARRDPQGFAMMAVGDQLAINAQVRRRIRHDAGT